MSNNEQKKSAVNLSRRSFLQTSLSLAATATFGSVLFKVLPLSAATYDGENTPDIIDENFKYVFSVCQNCHSRCGLVGKIKVTSTGHELVKLEGNPFHPNNLEEDERPKYADDVFSTINGVKYLTKPGRLCPKGQAGVQVVYNPYRIKHPLKRTGARGSGKWKTISWATAFAEIAAKTKSLITPWDSRGSTAIPTKDGSSSLGWIANHFMFSPGRSTDGDLIVRFFQKGIGTANFRLDHTSICETSHHIANSVMTQTDVTKIEDSPASTHYKADIEDASFLIYFGANPLEANFPFLALSRKIVDFKRKGGKLAVVDPRFSKAASKADYWVPVKPGTDGALALGLCRYLIDNNKVNLTFLMNCNAADAAADREKSWTDACYLVITDVGTTTVAGVKKGMFVTPKQLSGLTADDPGAGKTTTNKYCYWDGTKAVAVKTAVTAPVLEAEGVVVTLSDGKTVTCSTSYSLNKSRVLEKTIADYAAICGIDAALIETLGLQIAAAGNKACANGYRGAVQHTNGFYAQACINLLNMLIGNFDRKGGNTYGGGSWGVGKSAAGTISVTSFTGNLSSKGPRIDRSKSSSEHDKFAAALGETLGSPKRPWFPMAAEGCYQEIIPGIADQYPYPCKVFMSYWNATPYSTPAARKLWEATMKDGDTGDPDTMPSTAKIPLYVAIDPEIGESSSWADYILPDTTYLERFSPAPGVTPTIQTKFGSLRQPMVGTWDDETNFVDFADRYESKPTAENNYYCWMATKGNTDDSVAEKSWPKMFEDILIGLGKALGVPGVGTTANATASELTTMHNAWDFQKVLIQNLARNYKGADDLSAVTQILRKGGAFADPGTDASWQKNIFHMYIEQLVYFKDSLTNTSYDAFGLAKYEEIRGSKGTNIKSSDSNVYPYQLITYKMVEHGQARTIDLPFLAALKPENGLDISTADARSIGVNHGDYIKIASPSGYYTGPDGSQNIKAFVREGLRPGVVAFSHHFGHWQLSSSPSSDNVIDSTKMGYDPRRGKGIHLNEIMRTDPDIQSGTSAVTLMCRVGGSAAFNDTWVKIEKA